MRTAKLIGGLVITDRETFLYRKDGDSRFTLVVQNV